MSLHGIDGERQRTGTPSELVRRGVHDLGTMILGQRWHREVLGLWPVVAQEFGVAADAYLVFGEFVERCHVVVADRPVDEA